MLSCLEKANAEKLPHQKGWRKRLLRWSNITIDLKRPRHRRNLGIGCLVLLFLGTVFLFAGYEVYHYSESAEFCGTLCHPMYSLFVRYEISPHAKVSCAHCHIGEGVSYYVEAKLNGLRSLYYNVTDSYERPIKSPVHDLRPARETCEECHAPNSSSDNIIKTILRYDNDEANTPVLSTLILKMGGWQESTGAREGIHWHIANPVYYIAADEQCQMIMWVGAEQEDGSMKEYYARDMLTMAQTSFVEEARANGEIRQMDCIDCHNRTAHLIPMPEEVVDQAISAGLISRALPYIRAKATEVLMAEYASQAQAYEAIDKLVDFYRVDYPQVLDSQESELFQALAEIKRIYSFTHFPEMKLDWRTNPNNERHSPFWGCFRCHDGKHASMGPAGDENEVQVISIKCNLCHTVPIVGRGSNMLVEAPVVVGPVPASHSDYRYTIEHRTVTDDEQQECFVCHGQGFCNNETCHNLSHPPEMLFTHADEYRKTGWQVCYTCHQDFFCSRCHAGGVVADRTILQPQNQLPDPEAVQQ